MKTPQMRIGLLVAVLLPLVAQAQTAEIAATVLDEKGRPLADAVVVAVPSDGSLRCPRSRMRAWSIRSTRNSRRK
jgi:hypothetical protein